MGYAIGAVLSGSATDPCCCGGGDCCLYSWPGEVGSEVYPLDDLPDTIILTINGTPATLTKDAGSSPYSYSGIWGGGSVFLFAGEDPGSTWLFSVSSPEDLTGQSNGQCLISDYTAEGPSGPYITTVEDEFPDTLNVDGDPPYDLFRLTPCLWEGTASTEGGDVVVTLEYISDFAAWVGLVDFFGNPFPTKPFWLFTFGVGSLDQWFVKDDPQNGPTGTYGMGAITVS